MGTANNYCRK